MVETNLTPERFQRQPNCLKIEKGLRRCNAAEEDKQGCKAYSWICGSVENTLDDEAPKTAILPFKLLKALVTLPLLVPDKKYPPTSTKPFS